MCVICRSLCSLVCKWTYQADKGKSEWDESFFREVGLDELLLDNCSKIGASFMSCRSKQICHMYMVSQI